MQTVSFHCGHCGQLMAVGTDHLGQQVRCPHCNQVVMAPVTSTETPAAEPPVHEHESIFGTPDSVGEDLFGTVPAPTIEMPDSAPWYSDPEKRGAEKPSEQSNGPATSASRGMPTSVPARTWAESNVAASTEQTPELSGLDQPAPAQRSLEPAPHASDRANIGLLVLLIFLVPYAVCATAAAIYFYFQKVNTPHPLEAIPDFIGDKPGATRKNGHADIILERPSPDMDLPARDHVALHQTLTIGDLEVTPEKVERGQITIYRPLSNGKESITLPHEGLLLTLRVRNVSQDDFFYPADAYFYRRWQTNDPPANRPYTRLRIGDKAFYGGPVSWVPLQRDVSRYFVEGEENFTEILKPGQAKQLVICTDPENRAILGALKEGADAVEWRVQLRRGLMPFKGREIPTSAVVAVDFSAQDIQ